LVIEKIEGRPARFLHKRYAEAKAPRQVAQATERCHFRECFFELKPLPSLQVTEFYGKLDVLTTAAQFVDVLSFNPENP
jgi:hypothetical protein